MNFLDGGHTYGSCGVGVGQQVLLLSVVVRMTITMMMTIDRIKVRGMVDGDE